VVENHFAEAILNSDLLSAHVEHLLGPVVLNRVQESSGRVTALVHVGANTLVRVRSVPRKFVDDPQVQSLSDHGGLDLSNFGIENQIITECVGASGAHVIGLRATVLLVA